MKNIRLCKIYLDMEISRNRKKRFINLTQKGYTIKIVIELDIKNCQSSSTLLKIGLEIESAKKDKKI